MSPGPLHARSSSIRLLALCWAIAVTGCRPSPPNNFSIRVILTEQSITAGLSTTAKAQRVYANGRVEDVDGTTPALWVSSDTQVATVVRQADGTAEVTALNPGSSIITVLVDEKIGAASLAVTGASLRSIGVSPTSTSVPAGRTQQFTATGTYSDGSTRDVTSSVTWTSSNTSIATVNSSGLATGVAIGGPVTLTATLSGVSNTAQLTVTGWSSAGSMITARDRHTATLLPSGKVLIAGGYGSNRSLAIAELYDPATNSWSSAGTMASTRAYHTATLLPSGKVLIAGGNNEVDYHFTAELYDPATNTWSPAGTMAEGRTSHTATLLSSGKVLVSGGYANTFLSTAELYDPVTNTWSPAGSMSSRRHSHTATLLSSGKVLVAGAGGFSDSSFLGTAEVYDPATNSWSPAGSMSSIRGYHTATLLSSGKVLVAGGSSRYNSNYLATAEVYDPATNTWSEANSMTTARRYHTATLLSSGKVLVSGGFNGSTVNASAELYIP